MQIIRITSEFPQEGGKLRTEYSDLPDDRESKKGSIWPKVEATLYYYLRLIVYLTFMLFIWCFLERFTGGGIGTETRSLAGDTPDGVDLTF